MLKHQKIRKIYRRDGLLSRQKRPLMVDKKAVLKGLFHLFLMGSLIAVPILFYVWTRLEVVHLNYALLDISKEERKLFMKNEGLKVELAMLMSPSRLSSMAKHRFHLKNPSRNQIIYMK